MNSKQFLDNLSTHLKNAIAKAISLAASLDELKVRPVHLLIALSQESGSVAAEILKKTNFNGEIVADALRKKIKVPTTQKKAGVRSLPELHSSVKEVLEKAMLSAYEQEHNYIGTEHVLHGLIDSEDQLVLAILKQQSIVLADIEEQLHTVFTSVSKFPAVEEVIDAMEQIEQIVDTQSGNQSGASSLSITPQHKKKQVSKQPTALDMFATDLTAKHLHRQIDPVIGREREITRLIHILARRHKNNPVLVGEPGVGKTAIVEGLARRIAAGEVPDILRDKKILSLDLTLLLAGTIYRGEFEGRLKHIVDELTHREDCILFIDEIHNIIGAGSNQGTMDAANMLKPALARGQLRCIGATTFDEYKKYISNDPALSRRFLPVFVEEPSAEDTIQILTGISQYFDAFHGTHTEQAAIHTAVSLSGRYIHDNFFPDKAIDLIDEAAASVRSKRPTSPQTKKMSMLRQKIQTLKKQKEDAIIAEKFDEAITTKQTLEKLEKELLNLEKKSNKKETIKKPDPVTATDVTTVLANRLGINPELLIVDPWNSLGGVEKRLTQTIVGQDQVIKKVIQTLQQAQFRNVEEKKPQASFLFVGPSGVGKTELAKQLTKELYQNQHALIKLDMTEFSEAHGVSKLLGSPAGYVGYKERNRFLDEVQKKPYAIVLFDEIDKAHRDVTKLLLQILDEGELTDSTGKKISFKNTIIILTANIGAELFHSTGIGFGEKTSSVSLPKEIESAIVSRIKEELGATFMGRLDHIGIFSPLSEKHLSTIIHKKVLEISDRLAHTQHTNIVLDSSALETLTTDLFSPDAGARHVARHIERILYEQMMQVMDKKTKKKTYTLKKTNTGYRLS